MTEINAINYLRCFSDNISGALGALEWVLESEEEQI